MGMLSKEWFELRDHRQRQFSYEGWIPIYGTITSIVGEESHEVGRVEETLVVASAVIFNENRAQVEEINWDDFHESSSDLSQDRTTPHLCNDGRYFEADSFLDGKENKLGIRLVLIHDFYSPRLHRVWINQDFILAYDLLKKGDIWVRPSGEYEEVIREKRDDEGVAFVEVRSEYLKDYLAARKAALRLYYYRGRLAVFGEKPKFDWSENSSLVSEKHHHCQVICTEIDSRGHRCVGKGGRFEVQGRMWRGEWIEPNTKSCLIGYNEPKEPLMVYDDNSGVKVDLETFKYEKISYFYFNPKVINEFLLHRRAHLRWYSHDIGDVFLSSTKSLRFGVNELGLVNAYAPDVARAPLWEGRIWAAHNCKPDGGVSSELWKNQMDGNLVESTAPETLIRDALSFLNRVFQEKFGSPLLRDHHEVSELETRIHRFRGVDENGLRSLAKDIVKFSVERIDKKALVNALGEMKSDQGTIKLLQKLLAKYTNNDLAQDRMTSLFSLSYLRNADAHLSGSDTEDYYKKIGVDRSTPLVQQATKLLENVANAFKIIGSALEKHVPDPKDATDV